MGVRVNTTTTSLLTVTIMLLLAACSNFTVETDYTPETDFASFKTYRWYSATLRDPKSLDFLGGDIFDKRVRASIDHELQAKGYTLKAEGDVDFKINYDVLTELHRRLAEGA